MRLDVFVARVDVGSDDFREGFTAPADSEASLCACGHQKQFHAGKESMCRACDVSRKYKSHNTPIQSEIEKLAGSWSPSYEMPKDQEGFQCTKFEPLDLSFKQQLKTHLYL